MPLLIASGPTPVLVRADFPGANYNTYGQSKPSWDQGLLQRLWGFLAELLVLIKQSILITIAIISLIVIDQYLRHNIIAERCFKAKFVGQSKVT